jgi:anti-sigma factor RsiW
MDHDEATRDGATERYLLGTLDEAEREAFEEHYFDCVECAEGVRSAAAIMAAAGALPAEPAQLREPARQQAGDRKRAGAAARHAARARARGGLRQARTYAAALGGLAAGLCIAAYQGLVVIPSLEDRVENAESIQSVPSAFLTLSRSEAPIIAVSAQDRHLALTLSRSWDRPFTAYRVTLEDASGRTVLAETLRARAADAAGTGELDVLLPLRGLAAGSYVLVVEGQDGAPAAGAAPVARYAFELQRR